MQIVVVIQIDRWVGAIELFPNRLCFVCCVQVGKGLLSASGCGFQVCCITQARPCEVGALPLGRSSGLAGALCIMQDTRNSYLEVERRSFLTGHL